MSGRYLSDDHFWFTFFHEAGHLLLHKAIGPIIEERDISSKTMEEEANTFASEMLMTREFREELFMLNTSATRILSSPKEQVSHLELLWVNCSILGESLEANSII